MIDIVSFPTGLPDDPQDLGVQNTQVPKAANLLSVQLNSLEYLKGFGIDMNFFLSEGFVFQNESFKAYLIETLTNNGINVANVTEVLYALYEDLYINISPEQSSTALLAR